VTRHLARMSSLTEDASGRSTATVHRHESSPTRSRSGTGSGGESSSMLAAVEGDAVQALTKGKKVFRFEW
jgi:hypothetical protein